MQTGHLLNLEAKNLRILRTSSRRTTAFAAALLIIGLAACGGADDSDESQQGEPSAAKATEEGSSDNGGDESDEAGEDSAAEQSSAVSDGECPIREGSSGVVTETPQVDEWTMLGDIAVPTSETYGPYERDGDLWTCYEHSAEGALFATAYMFRASGNVEGFAEAWITEGELQDEVIEAEKAPETDSTDWDSMTLAGFRYQSYTDEMAVIDLAVDVAADGSSQLVYMRIAHRWEGDRWLVDYESSGGEAVAIDSLDGFVSWRG